MSRNRSTSSTVRPRRQPSDDMDAKLAQLKSLGELKTQGVLT